MTLNNLTGFLQRYVPRKAYLFVRPFAAIALELINWKVETLSFPSVRVQAYADFYFPNNELAEEILGYFRHYIPKKGDIVIDAGAYSGIFTIAAAKLVGKKGLVIAYEPDPFNRLRLRRNIALNHLSNVIIRPYGLYDKEVNVDFEVRQVASRIAENKESVISVSMRPLDMEMKILSLTKVNMIKMDIEGAEVSALKGAKQMLKAFRKTLHFAIASYHRIHGKQTCIWLGKFFPKMGFCAVTEYPRHKTTYAWKKNFSRRTKSI